MLIIAIGAFITSCTDNTFNDGNSNSENASVRLTLCLPCGDIASTRAGGTDASTGTNDGEEYERQLTANDLHLLIFEKDQLKEEVTNLQLLGTEGSANRILYGITSKTYDENVDIVVLANLKGCEVSFDSNSYIGKSKEEIYQSLKYSFDKFEKENGIPMWGTLSLPQIKSSVTADINLYRAVAKIGITVNEGNGLDNFTLTSVRAYFSNTEGYCTPINVTAKELENQEILYPSVPSTSEQRDITSPLSFEGLSGNDFKNQLYISEAANKTLGEGKKAVCLVVGGKYTGEGLVDAETECYYRIDFKDDLESSNKNDLKAYDLVRNHLYQFDITKVSNPGTPTPEEALDNVVVGMHVTITDWVDVPMRGVPDQYTLTTDKSVVNFKNEVSEPEKITVTTDYGQSSESTENGPWKIVDQSDATWFTVEQGSDNRTIYITATANFGVAREGSFYIQTGNLKKEIIVRQEQPASANCYVVGEGTHKLIVTIKGNGNKGLVAEGVTLDTDASIKPAKIGIIWETKAGLVKLIDAVTGTQISGDTYAKYDENTGTIQYVVNTNSAEVGGITGGNALIGAFDDNGKILWSWHIWVCPNMMENKIIKESCVQDWTLNGYEVLDRNLGALSNSPGVASLGLLYQWGRKDPFIGAGYTNDNYTDTGVLVTVNYHGKNWDVNGKSSNNTNIPYTIANPTILTYDGLSLKVPTIGGYLWGTNGGLNKEGIKDLGSKTIYDPCPEGYRVPPVDAFVFTKKEKTFITDKSYSIILYKGEKKTLSPPVYINNILYTTTQEISGSKYGKTFYISEGHYETGTAIEKSSETSNWNDNLIYIPHKASSWNGSYYTGKYVENANHYGFYLNYKELSEPDLASGTKDDNEIHYDLKSYNNLTWLPISGAYDPHVNSQSLSFNGITVTQGSSLSVNSFLWTNSSVKSSDKVTRPAAMFLHGTEKNSTINGRHIHALLGTSTSDNIIAEPQQAGAIRCVRDVKKDFSESNKAPGDVSLGKSVGYATTKTLISVNDSWTIVDGGAPWFKISPDRGGLDKGKGQDITFTTVQANNTGSNRTATVLIKFASEVEPRSFKVTQLR